MKKNTTQNPEHKRLPRRDLPSSINMGSHNIYGRIGDIVAGDLIKVVNFKAPFAEPEIISKWENAYINNMISSMDVILSRTVDGEVFLEEERFINQESAIASLAVFPPYSVGNSFSNQYTKSIIPLENARALSNRVSSSWILGELGIGKTTFLIRLGYLIGKDWLEWFKNKQDNILYKSSFYIPDAPPLPVFIRPNSLTEVKSLNEMLEIALLGTPLAGLATKYLEKGKLAILFDDVDVLDNEGPNNMIPKIRNIITKIPQNRYFLVTRSKTLTSFVDLPVVHLEPVNEGKLQLILQTYLGTNHGKKLYKYLRDECEGIWDWITIPYVIRILCELYVKGGGIFPQGIYSLLEGYVKFHYDQGLQSGLLQQKDIQPIQSLLCDLAFYQKRENQIPPINAEWIQKQIGTCDEKALEKAISLGLLIGTTQPVRVEFPHEVLQDYFIAVRLSIIIRKNTSNFRKMVHATNYITRSRKYIRGQFWRKEDDLELQWDTPLPPLQRSIWEGSMSILISNQRGISQEKAYSALLDEDSLTLASIIVRNKNNLDIKPQLIHKLLELIESTEMPIAIRIASGDYLGALGDPRIGDTQMLKVDAGEYKFGVGKDVKHISISPFHIDQFPVTNDQYRHFIDAGNYFDYDETLWTEDGISWLSSTGRRKPTYWDDPRFNKPNYPVVGVSWYEALAYAKWIGKRLPAEEEWEYISTFDPETKRKFSYPWCSNNFDIEQANVMVGNNYVYSTTPVGVYPNGKTKLGVHDLCGNVWEWLNTTYTPTANKVQYSGTSLEKCLRGGSWALSFVAGGICTYRGHASPYNSNRNDFGFRCVKNV